MFEGPVLGLLVRLSLPIFVGMAFQLLYAVVDTLWVSRIDPSDPSYVGGMGIIFPLVTLVIAVGSGVLVGTSSLVARAIGEKAWAVLDRTAGSGLVVGLGAGTLLLALGYVFDEEIIRILGGRGDYFTHALEYFRSMLPAGFLMLAGNVLIGILQGEGLMKKVMKAVVIGTAANVVLDPVFIFLLGLGVRGAGYATTIAQLAAGTYLVSVFIKKKTAVPIRWKPAAVDAGIIRRIVSVGLPQTAGYMALSASQLMFNRILVGIDSRALAASAICGRFDQMLIMPILSIGSAAITMIGQNYGRGNHGRIRLLWRTSLLCAGATVAAIASLLFILAPRVYQPFTEVDAVLRYSVLQTRIVAFTYLGAAAVAMGRALFQAIGRAFPGFLVDSLRLAAISVPAAYLYVKIAGLGAAGVWLGVATGNVCAAMVTFLLVSRTLKNLSLGVAAPGPRGLNRGGRSGRSCTIRQRQSRS